MEYRNHWLKLDNAAKIYPAASNDSRSMTFRLAFYLKEEVDPTILEKAVNNLLPRFDSFNVKFKKGLFWNYFAANNKYFKVEKENAIIGQYKLNSHSRYCFRVLYFGTRITLETFHSLADGTGAMEFLKSIVFEYLKLKGHKINPENKIFSEKIATEYEKMDAFSYSYDKHNKLPLREEKAYKIKGEIYPNNWNLFVKSTVNTDAFLNVCRSKNVTATQYTVALIVYSIYKNQPGCFNSKKPIKVLVPVNLRKYFDFYTLRNFSLYIKITIHTYHKHLSFEDILAETCKQFDEQLNKETMIKRMNANVYFEKLIVFRLVPQFIKNLALKIAYKVANDKIVTLDISNLGRVDLPEEMYDYIHQVDFANVSEKLSVTMITLKDKMNIIFSSKIKNLSIIYDVINTLKKENLDLVIQTNYEG